MGGYYKRSEVKRTTLRTHQSFSSGIPGAVRTSTSSADHRSVMSWRTRPSSEDVPVPDHIADPYAYFLRFNPAAYRSAQKARGLPVDGPLLFDTGHPYTKVQHVVQTVSDGPVETWSGPTQRTGRWENPLFTAYDPTPLPFMSKGPGIPARPVTNLAHFAKVAISKTAPTYVVFDLARFIGELREGLPRMFGTILSLRSRADFFRSLGSEYLNAQFGWKPLLQDIEDLLSVFTDTSRMLQELPLFGTPQRRSFSLPSVTSSSTLLNTSAFWGLSVFPTDPITGGSISGSLSSAAIRLNLFKSSYTRYNFRGAYTKMLPVGFRADSYLQRVGLFTSTEINPATLWELSPWSWLIDWATEISDVIASNQLADDESLFIHYAYATEVSNLQSRHEVAFWNTSSGSERIQGNRPSTLVSTTWVNRIRANPYGFTVGGFDGLSASQAAILSALGMSRLR